jgi:hypothetical protein
MADRSILSVPPLVAVAGWLLPGAGYFLIGQRARGIVVGAAVIMMFLSGILIAGIRVIDVPGYDSLGFEVRVRNPALVTQPGQFVGQKLDWRDRDFYKGDRALTARPLGEIVNKPWYVGQVLTGPICLLSSKFSLDAAKPADIQAARSSRAQPPSRIAPSHARVAEIGSLYTAIAGMLNLLAIIDSASRAGREEEAAEPTEAAAV